MGRLHAYVAVSLLTSFSAHGQDSPKPPPKIDDRRLDEILVSWEKAASKIDSLTTKVERTVTDSFGRKKKTEHGTFAFLRPDVVKIDFTCVDQESQKSGEECMIILGRRVDWKRWDSEHYETFQIADKESANWLGRLLDFRGLMLSIRDDFFFLKGMKPADFKNRFEIKSLKESEWYIYLSFKPKSESAEGFWFAELVLFAKNPNAEGLPDLSMLPARLHLKTGLGDRTYMFSEMRPNAGLKLDWFKPNLAPRVTIPKK